VPDATSCADALAICRRYGIELPPAALAGLESGAFETPKPGDARFDGHRLTMLATPQQSLEAAADAARTLGLDAHILSDEMEGESREVGKVQAALARAVARRDAPFKKPCVILSGGETTVTVKAKGETLETGRPPGRGGRATEFLLGAAIALQGEPGVHLLAADTDGIDGVEDNAGAIVTPSTLTRAAALGLNAQHELDANNAYGFFAPLGDLVSPGPTFTNVNDFRALLVL
jgi:glycerate 2-kinase